jgi:hypothetical protein
MKIWFGYGSEHSSNIVLIGRFKTLQDAEGALELLKQAEALATREYEAGRLETIEHRANIPNDVMEFIKARNFYTLTLKDLTELIYEFHPKLVDSTLVITTNEYDVGAFIKIMTERNAKVEVYSAHDYPSQYGRQTYRGD